MTKKRFLILLIFPFILMSCDPAHTINFINQGKNNVKVKLVINPKTQFERLDDIKVGDSIVFNLKPYDTEENEDGIYFGIGVWNENLLKTVAEDIKRIEIENNDYKTIYKSQKSIEKILIKNQEGFWWKTAVNIKINDDLTN